MDGMIEVKTMCIEIDGMMRHIPAFISVVELRLIVREILFDVAPGALVSAGSSDLRGDSRLGGDPGEGE